MNLKKVKGIYLLTILSSSLFYAFSTTKIISYTNLSPFTVVLLNALIELFIYLDINYIRRLTRMSTKNISVMGMISFLITQLLFVIKFNDYVILLIAYVLCSFIFNLYLLCLENVIVDFEKNARNGLVSITLLRISSKVVGFGLGAFFQYVSIWHYTFILLFTFLILSTVNIENKGANIDSIVSIKRLNSKYLILTLLFLGSVSVFTIPKLIKDLNEQGMSSYSSITFMLPGIFAILYLKYLKDSKFNNNFKLKNIAYILLISIYLIVQHYETLFFLRIFMISMIITISISITIDIRAWFIQRNGQAELKNLLQLMNLIYVLSILFFSITSFFIVDITVIIFMINIISSLFLLFDKRRGENYENRIML
ncbi:hypothetical protein [Staphylococcus americanisciuri]|uniref:Uncharacterized protein n=1 Tax=Staphylococcus americanisciuri TaxID=2973940 RepID=A0ABT2F115_9STAP|nr:hypothetical protein [Staphylococcus americanisciuri]MCS4486144.1 hypothetical protein [Staphylococcus americanisciuri]